MSWVKGNEIIDKLLEGRELQRVEPDPDLAHQLSETSGRHLASAKEIQSRDPEGAFAAAYDAARKACAALLQAQGLRPTSRGGHVALRDAVLAQFADMKGGSALRSFDRLRRRRHAIEYPSGLTTLDDDELKEAIERVQEIVSFSGKLVDRLRPF